MLVPLAFRGPPGSNQPKWAISISASRRFEESLEAVGTLIEKAALDEKEQVQRICRRAPITFRLPPSLRRSFGIAFLMAFVLIGILRPLDKVAAAMSEISKGNRETEIPGNGSQGRAR